MAFHRFQARPLRVILLLCAAVSSLLGLGLEVAPSQAAGEHQIAPSAAYSLYLPLVMNQARQGTPPSTPPPPPSTKGAFFVSEEGKTNSAGLAIDANGGMHMVFTVFTELANHPPAVYAYCPGPAATCADQDNWKAVGISDLVDEVQIKLTSDGKPRMLIRKQREGYTQDEYVYAQCDTTCTEKMQWQLTSVAYAGGTDVFGKDNPQHSFALDPQDRPRFIFSNGWGAGYPVGVYYAYCDDICDNGDNWYGTQILQGPLDRSLSFDFPALAFTRDGRPRVFANVSFSGEAQGISYLECDADCGDIAGWDAVRLYDRGGGVAASWDLELDAQDRPRVAFYQAGLDDGSGDRLFYAWCDAADCLTAAGWQRKAIDLEVSQGQNADLALDTQGRPRMAYKINSGLGYAWCNTACETAGAQWQRKVIETSAELQQDFPVPWPTSCDPSVWTDPIPALALDAQGLPRIAYDNLSVAKCYYTKPGDPNTYSKIEKLFRAVRWLYFAQP
jgi:hypothetical protein